MQFTMTHPMMSKTTLARSLLAVLLGTSLGAPTWAQNFPVTPAQQATASQVAQNGVPLSELKEHLAEIPREQPVIAVCHSGMRSGQATVILRQAGFPRFANLRGGMLLWRQLGLPVEQSPGMAA